MKTDEKYLHWGFKLFFSVTISLVIVGFIDVIFTENPPIWFLIAIFIFSFGITTYYLRWMIRTLKKEKEEVIIGLSSLLIGLILGLISSFIRYFFGVRSWIDFFIIITVLTFIVSAILVIIYFKIPKEKAS
jgi:uncharacterized protein YacL